MLAHQDTTSQCGAHYSCASKVPTVAVTSAESRDAPGTATLVSLFFFNAVTQFTAVKLGLTVSGCLSFSLPAFSRNSETTARF